MPDVPDGGGNAITARLAGIEQKLQHVDERLARCVTREQLDERLKRYPTREEVVEMHVETRRHFDVVAQGLRADIRLVAEGQSALVSRMDAMHQDTVIGDRVENHELRLTRLETHIGVGPITTAKPQTVHRRPRKPGR